MPFPPSVPFFGIDRSEPIHYKSDEQIAKENAEWAARREACARRNDLDVLGWAFVQVTVAAAASAIGASEDDASALYDLLISPSDDDD